MKLMKRTKYNEGDEVEFKIKGKVTNVYDKGLAGHILVSIPYLDDKYTTILVNTKNNKVKKIG
jgi:hypothetical protein